MSSLLAFQGTRDEPGAGAQDHRAAGLVVQAAGVVACHPAAVEAGLGHNPGDEGHDGAPESNRQSPPGVSDGRGLTSGRKVGLW
jgi:hypothetical protein